MCWGENDLVGDLYQTARVVGFFLASFTAMKSSALCALADWFWITGSEHSKVTPPPPVPKTAAFKLSNSEVQVENTVILPYGRFSLPRPPYTTKKRAPRN